MIDAVVGGEIRPITSEGVQDEDVVIEDGDVRGKGSNQEATDGSKL